MTEKVLTDFNPELDGEWDKGRLNSVKQTGAVEVYTYTNGAYELRVFVLPDEKGFEEDYSIQLDKNGGMINVRETSNYNELVKYAEQASKQLDSW